MTRTVMTSIARTCPACHATNTVVAVTTEIRPFWHMNCSRCGAPIDQDCRAEPGGWQDARRAPGAALVRVPAPLPASGKRGAATATQRRRRGLSRCCSGLQVAAGAALGMACTALLLTAIGPADRPGAGPDTYVLAAAPEPAASAREPLRAAPAADLPASRSAGAWDAAVEAALEAELAHLEVLARHAQDHGPHPDAIRNAGAPIDPEAAARAEAALDLSRRDRRELQRRLSLAEHDPRLVDGIFGPATRAAIAGWQDTVGLPPTGYFDEQALALLEQQTEERFRAWQVAENKRDRGRRTQTAGLDSPVPAAAPASARCQRTWSGEIAYGRTVLCDFRGLRENVAQLFRASERS